MALTGKQSKANQAGTKTRREPKSRTLQHQKTAPKQDALRTRRRTDVDQKELAALLSQKALAGDLDSAKLLFNLAGRNKQAPPAPIKRPGPSLAQLFALDPPWQGGDEDPYRDEPYPPRLPEPKPEP